MITLLITLFVIVIIQFSIFLILEYTNIKQSKKLNENEHDKLYDYNRFNTRNSCDNSGQSNKELNEREKA